MKKKSFAVRKEWKIIEKAEEKRAQQVYKKSNLNVVDKIETKIPDKIYENLKKAFAKAFEIVFEKGVRIIEKTYDKDDLQKDFEIKDFAVQKKGTRKEFKNLHKQAKENSRINMLVSTVEGGVLGALGIGLPDIVIFTGMILKGAYETALHYGYDYNSDAEKYLILQFIEGALAKEDTYMTVNKHINAIIDSGTIYVPTLDEMNNQIIRTSDAMAADMLVMKFIQGLPLVGLVGGLMNPVYYQKITGYIQLKYRRRYLQKNHGFN